MEVVLQKAGKRYRYEWIFRNLSFEFPMGCSVAVSGPNGSGKTTLLRMLSGHLSPSEGNISFSFEGKNLSSDEVYRHISLAAPWMELIEIFTPEELVHFHRQLRPFIPGIGVDEFLEIAGLVHARSKQIRFYSSGMKQRLKLALAFCTTGSAVILDEPTSNLDAAGTEWYHDLIEKMRSGRTLIIASNVESDFRACTQRIHIPAFKPASKR